MFVYSAREFPFFYPAERNRLNKCKARVKKPKKNTTTQNENRRIKYKVFIYSLSDYQLMKIRPVLYS